jgi:hypothetical protein
MTALLMGKKFVLSARKLAERSTGLAPADYHLANTALLQSSFDPACRALLLAGFRDSHPDGTIKSLVDSYLINPQSIPANLRRLLRLLYLLRNSTLLSDSLQHPDDIDIIRTLYLNGNFATALRMQCPKLYLLHPSQPETFQEMEPDSLCMQSDSLLVFDQYYDIFIWVGLQLAQDPATLTALQELASQRVQSLAEPRFPYPHLLTFRESTSMARWLSARLAPAHLDPWNLATRTNPQLLTLNDAARKALLQKFHPSDDLCVSAWLRLLANGNSS